jgi:hypothetical protein
MILEGTMRRIQITLGEIVVTGTLNDSNTARLICETLPIGSVAKLWGDEVYFDAPIIAGEEDPVADVPSGTLAYWPPGKALCLFFGEKPYSPVNVVGQLEGDAGVLAKVRDGDAVRVESA